jgi:hypothetical protein
VDERLRERIVELATRPEPREVPALYRGRRKKPVEEKKLPRHLVGNAGVIYVSHRLSQMGWNAMPTTRNAKGPDAVVASEDAKRTWTLQVKNFSKPHLLQRARELAAFPTALLFLIHPSAWKRGFSTKSVSTIGHRNSITPTESVTSSTLSPTGRPLHIAHRYKVCSHTCRVSGQDAYPATGRGVGRS